MNYLILLLTLLISAQSWAGCPEFETTLELMLKKVTAREVAKEEVKAKAELAAKWAGPEGQQYKARYANEANADAKNRAFMSAMDAEKKGKVGDVIYFDVENAVQKRLNDSIVGDKGMVDAINNSFMEKFNKNLKEFPDIAERLKGQYQDYKSLRLRLTLKPGDKAAELEKKLSSIYQKTNTEFASEFEKMGLTKLVPPNTDGISDVSAWFLSGIGDSAIEANMAARGARAANFSNGKAVTMTFREQVESMYTDIHAIEKLRLDLAGNAELLSSKIMVKTASGEVIPSKDMIAILRKIKLSECEDAAEYAEKIRSKVQTMFKSNISDKHIEDLTTYFQKVDSLSPPLFQRERVLIDLAEAKNGIVSVDFTGVGVENAYEQMRALSAVNYAQGNKEMLLKEAFKKVQGNVDNVTADMIKGKRSFSSSSRISGDGSVPKFSGDDGILMPKEVWGEDKKRQLIQSLADTGDPSKFRVTFVKTEYASGKVIPATERSRLVVRAESVEKDIREAITGQLKIPSERAKKMIIAIDFSPSPKGGKFNVLIGGQKPTPTEKKMILEALQKTMQKKNGEIAGELIEAF